MKTMELFDEIADVYRLTDVEWAKASKYKGSTIITAIRKGRREMTLDKVRRLSYGLALLIGPRAFRKEVRERIGALEWENREDELLFLACVLLATGTPKLLTMARDSLIELLGKKGGV